MLPACGSIFNSVCVCGGGGGGGRVEAKDGQTQRERETETGHKAQTNAVTVFLSHPG